MALDLAFEARDPRAMGRALAAGANPNPVEGCLLLRAVGMCQSDPSEAPRAAAVLLAWGADPDRSPGLRLSAADSAVSMLSRPDRGGYPSRDSAALLFVAALADGGATLPSSALAVALGEDLPEEAALACSESLVRSGRLPTAADFARCLGRPRFMALLASSGAMRAKDGLGRGPLHLAAFEGDSSSVRMLISEGAGVGAEDGRGRDPLMLCAMGGVEEGCAAALLGAGADPSRLCQAGMDAMGYARGAGPEAAARLEALLVSGCSGRGAPKSKRRL